MGYTTDFNGKLNLTPSASPEQMEYLEKFIDTRRMGRNVDELMKKFNGEFGLPLMKTNLLPRSESGITDLVDNGEFVPLDRTAIEIYGNEGEFFIGDETTGVIDHNTPPGQLGYSENFNVRYTENEKRIKEGKCQPGLWCQWELNNMGSELQWNGAEKFYYYIEWLQYMITNFFTPWGITLNGEIEWNGEDRDDIGKIVVKNNVVNTYVGKITY